MQHFIFTIFQKKSNHSSSNSKSSNKMNVTMSRQKVDTKKKRIKAQAKKKIKKLFERLRNDSSNSSVNSSQNSSIIEILNNTVNETSPISNKRKCTDINSNEKVKLRKSNSDCNLIIIKDDDDVINTGRASCNSVRTPRKNINSSPIQCSTPIADNDKTLKELNISRVSNLKNNNNCNVAQNLNEELNSLTKEINQSSFLTIDLTTETDPNKTNETNSQNNTVIDLINTSENQDCVFVSASNYSLSMSGDSDVTVLKKPLSKTKEKQIRKFAHGISRLNAYQKGRLLELITQNVFNGCKTPTNLKKCSNTSINTSPVKTTQSRTTETAEDTYIREIILGQTPSRNSIGSNIYNPTKDVKHKTGLRMVVIDGSNVAMEHGKGREFSVKGLQICIDYFIKRGHVVKAFVPRFRCKFGKSSNPRLLDDLERRALVVYTPSREIQGKLITSYDDRYIVQCAAEFDGVIVSGDNYRDLLQENPRWRFVIENRLLPFTWVNDMLMFPKDPLGRHGPTLEQFLRHPPNSNHQLSNNNNQQVPNTGYINFCT